MAQSPRGGHQAQKEEESPSEGGPQNSTGVDSARIAEAAGRMATRPFNALKEASGDQTRG